MWKKTALITVYGSKNKKDHHISITEIHAAPLTPVLKKKRKDTVKTEYRETRGDEDNKMIPQNDLIKD